MYCGHFQAKKYHQSQVVSDLECLIQAKKIAYLSELILPFYIPKAKKRCIYLTKPI